MRYQGDPRPGFPGRPNPVERGADRTSTIDAMKKRERTSRPAPQAVESLHDLLADVTPLPQPKQARLERPRPHPVPYQRLRDEKRVLADSLSDVEPWSEGLETGEELVYLREGIPAQTLKRLRRGHWVIQDELDLHGLTVSEARALLMDFLADCKRRGLRCVRVIHGKGLRSRNREPVLKKKVANWLARRDEVLAFCQARPTEGGGGAVVVLLKGGRRKAGGGSSARVA
jgi:DNA-nicking Smr family endonuclease